MLAHSDKFKAAWIYQIFPMNDFTDLQKGSLKAFLIKLFVPIYLVLSLIFCIIFGVRIIPDLAAIFVTSCLYTVICYKGFGSNIPFTKPTNEIGDAQGWKTFILMIPLVVLAGAHYLMATKIPFGIYLYVVLLIIINWVVWKVVFRRRK